MDRHEAYSVMVTDDKGRRGTGTLFYTANSDFFYILTCAHVIYTSEKVTIHILIPTGGDPEEKTVHADKNQFHFSPIDEPTVIGDQSTHTCDVAVIECPVDNLVLEPTRYAMFPMTNRERIIAFGYPKGSGPLFYQQDNLTATVEKVLDNQNNFLIRVNEDSVNSADREAELKGYSGSPVWDEDNLEKEIYLLGGLIAVGVGSNISRGRVNVMNAKVIQSLMRDEFGIMIEMKVPNVPQIDIAPGYECAEDTEDQIVVRDSWIENERRKAQTYVDSLQLQKAVDISRETIANSEFEKCTPEQKYKIYAVLLEAYRLARDYDEYDAIREEMHQAGIRSDREYLIEAVRYYEALDNDKAEEYIKKALEIDPDDNETKALALAIHVANDENADISLLSSFIGSRDQLLIKPKDDKEEESIYHILGFVLGNCFKETGRAIRCLNRAFQISGNYIVLESLAVTYYLHSIRNAFIDEGVDRVDQIKIDQDELEKSRDAFLRVLSAADEMWLRGTIRRAGPLMFKCFYFMHDNYRIYKHYHDMMMYFDFPDNETLRDIQICYLEVAIQKEPVNLDEYKGLTVSDKKFFELIQLLHLPPQMFIGGMQTQAYITEEELHKKIEEGESLLRELIDIRSDERIGYDGIHTIFINLYGVGIIRYGWRAITEVRRHAEEIIHSAGQESIDLFIYELDSNDLESSEKKYREFFEKKRDVISFNEWCHFYTRNGLIEKTKELYDSVLCENRFLIETQSEFFFREYILFYMEHHYDLTEPIRCFVEYKDEIKDVFLRLFFEQELDFATVTFNDPDSMLDTARTLFDEGLIEAEDYDQRCLIINMLNCRPFDAERHVDPTHEYNPILASEFERMLFVWKGHPVMPDRRWNSMQKWTLEQLDEIYNDEDWHRPVEEILKHHGTGERKAIVVDLWAIYCLQKIHLPVIMNYFEKVYITHDTISMALQEINKVNDIDIRGALRNFQFAENVIIKSPTIEEQLEVRNPDLQYMEIHQALLLAELLDCPAFVGEFRYPIPDRFKNRIIRPNHCVEMYRYMDGILMLEEKTRS